VRAKACRTMESCISCFGTADLSCLFFPSDTDYRGNFDNYVKLKNEKMKNAMREYQAYQSKRDHMMEFIEKFRANAKRATMVSSVKFNLRCSSEFFRPRLTFCPIPATSFDSCALCRFKVVSKQSRKWTLKPQSWWRWILHGDSPFRRRNRWDDQSSQSTMSHLITTLQAQMELGRKSLNTYCKR
jgi:hypothetical protein